MKYHTDAGETIADILSKTRPKAAIHRMAGATAEEREAILARERQARRTGEWGAWKRVDSQYVKPGDEAYECAAFLVRVRDVKSAIHLSVVSMAGERPTWWEMQRVKNEIAGPEATAVEVYPPQSEIVDTADSFHIWIVPPLPFSLRTSRPSQEDAR